MAAVAEADVVIVGAGPYGLSIAAHLRAAGVDFRILGRPMQTWTTAMPRGMCLKSEGFASNLYDPGHSFTLGDYCAEKRLEYADIGYAVPLETFVAYGLAFQERFVPDLDQRCVSSIRQLGDRFSLRLQDDETITAPKVVLAVGITPFSYVAPVLANLPAGLASHSSAHVVLDEFADRDVALIGGGSSAFDLAVLLHRAGARPVVVVRNTSVEYNSQNDPWRPLITRVQRPLSCIGQDWRRFIFTKAPQLFHALPQSLRLRQVRTTHSPAAGWSVRAEVEQHVPIHLGRSVSGARAANGRVCLELRDVEGAAETLEVDHVISCTGYRVDLDRLDILDHSIRSRVHAAGGAPALSTNFESSLPGLYFAGVSAMNSFGPVFRFACGAEYAASKISRHLAGSAARPGRAAHADSFSRMRA